MTAAEYQLPFQLYVFTILLILSLYSSLLFYVIRCVPVTAPPPLISMIAHALSGRRYDAEFHRWFVPEYKHGRGSENLMEISLKAAEFLVDLFATVWSTLGQTTKVPYGSRKYQVTYLMTITTSSFET